MLVGHVAVGLAAKRVEPGISAGTLVLAALAADVLWTAFIWMGLEHVRFDPDALGAANYIVASDIAWSHSLLTNLLAGALFAGSYWMLRRNVRGARVLFAVVASHWILDVVSHRPDLPIAPGLGAVVGLGLWTSIPATLIVEGGLWLCAIVLYAAATVSGTRTGASILWTGAVVLTLPWYNNIAGPPPADPQSVPVGSFTFFALVVGWAYLVDWLRRPRAAAPRPGAPHTSGARPPREPRAPVAGMHRLQLTGVCACASPSAPPSASA